LAESLGIEVDSSAAETLRDTFRARTIATRHAHIVEAEREKLAAEGTDGALRAAVDATEWRLKMIATTEAFNAVSRERIRAAEVIQQETGVALEKEWNAQHDSCPLCAEMDGERVPLDSSFSNGAEPGQVHPSCMCWVEILRADAQKSGVWQRPVIEEPVEETVHVPEIVREAQRLESLPFASLPADIEAPVGIDLAAMDREANAKLKTLPRGTVAALDRYTGRFYTEIRQAPLVTDDAFAAFRAGPRKAHLRDYEKIQNIFKAHATPSELALTDVYRGIKGLPREAIDTFLRNPTFTLESITSTTWDPKLAKVFATEIKDEHSVIMRFRLAPGADGVAVVGSKVTGGLKESEILLQRGKQFRLVSATRAEGTEKTVLLDYHEVSAPK
jgi:hypothetical protein